LACTSKERIFEKGFFGLDTYITVKIVCAKKSLAEELQKKIISEAGRLQALFGAYDSTSPVWAANHRLAGVSEMNVPRELALLGREAQEIAKETDGAFDMTVGPIKWLWGFGITAEPRVPGQARIDSVLPLVDHALVEVDTSKALLRFLKKGVQIDLGGIAKGYAVQRFAGILSGGGIRDFLIDAGGEVYVSGTKPEGREWVLGVRNPRQKDQTLTVFPVKGPATLATSGDYERFFFQDGKRYHHLFDPKTGYPARGCISCTILAQDPVRADGLSTAVFVMGPDNGIDFVNRLEGVEAIMVLENADGSLSFRASDGWANSVQ
jgi:thiamine biosynthesis lipoprotein